eukprot:TRINITY_DN34325_c0_g1_i1.p1 TRINITY_DN34325_c0_g1~~TRINITY_DN34325_c0_g1_i1.p1  ORF type:complete len:171 (-),score=35.68 TRINITY_DN34325_c0_g1_i1:53-565(-)
MAPVFAVLATMSAAVVGADASANASFSSAPCVPPACTYLPCGSKQVGTCSIFKCDARHGATTCISGRCICDGNKCASVDRKTCVEPPVCQKQVGTCRVLKCNADHGATDCIQGLCICSGSSCTTDGNKCSSPSTPRRRHAPRISSSSLRQAAPAPQTEQEDHHDIEDIVV